MRLGLATPADLWAFFDAQLWPPSDSDYREALAVSRAGRLHAAFDDAGVPVAIGGITDAGGVWLDVTPAAAVRFAPVALMMRRVLRAAGACQPLWCLVRLENLTGLRLAAVLGFGVLVARRGELGVFMGAADVAALGDGAGSEPCAPHTDAA